MVDGPSSYHLMLGAAAQGKLPVLIPTHIDGQPVVVCYRMAMAPRAALRVMHPRQAERARIAIAAAVHLHKRTVAEHG